MKAIFGSGEQPPVSNAALLYHNARPRFRLGEATPNDVIRAFSQWQARLFKDVMPTDPDIAVTRTQATYYTPLGTLVLFGTLEVANQPPVVRAVTAHMPTNTGNYWRERTPDAHEGTTLHDEENHLLRLYSHGNVAFCQFDEEPAEPLLPFAQLLAEAKRVPTEMAKLVNQVTEHNIQAAGVLHPEATP